VARRLEEQLAQVTPALHGLAGQLQLALDGVRRRLAGSPVVGPVTCHGDYKHNQLLFGDGPPTLVDLDTLCRAEPALDLGQFLAYLQLKLTGDDAPAPAAVVDRLSRRFLDGYMDAAGVPPAAAAGLEDRARSYAALSLVQRGLHSWQKFKPERVGQVMRLLEQSELR
jgi:aminoglycoside phosphotransferase (APT) family kinase protein